MRFDLHRTGRDQRDIRAVAAADTQGHCIQHDRVRAIQITIGELADFIAGGDGQLAAGGLHVCTIRATQHLIIGQMRGEVVAFDIRSTDFAGSAIGDELTVAHCPIDLRIEARADGAPVRYAGVIQHGTLRYLDQDVTGTVHTDAGAEQHVAVFGRHADRAASGGDIGFQRDGAADTASDQRHCAIDSADALTTGDSIDCTVRCRQIDCAVGCALHDFFDLQCTDVLQRDVAAGAVRQVQAMHLGMQRIGRAADAIGCCDHQTCIHRCDIGTGVAALDIATTMDLQVTAIAGDQLTDDDIAGRAQRNQTAAGIDHRVACHFQGATNGVQRDVTAGRIDRPRSSQRQVRCSSDADIAEFAGDCAIQIDRTVRGAECDALRNTLRGDLGVDDQVRIGIDADVFVIAADDAGDGHACRSFTCSDDSDAAFGGQIERIGSDVTGRGILRRSVASGDRPVQGTQGDVTAALDTVDVDIAVQ